MERRELLKLILVATGSAMVGGEAFFLSGCKPRDQKEIGLLSTTQMNFLDQFGETILPATDTPGAREAKVGEFMNVYVADCYRPEEREVFMNGITMIEKLSKDKYKKDFIDLTPEESNALLMILEPEAKAFNMQLDEREKSARGEARLAMKEFTGAPVHYYTLMKQLTIFGFFTSEIAAKKVLRLLSVPGKYDGAYPYAKGDRAWFVG